MTKWLHSFVKRATQSTSKIDSLLKTLQVRPSPPEALVQAYLIHIADRSDTNFRKILELKGIRKQEQNLLVDLFNAHCMSANNASLPASSAFLTPLQLTAASHAGGNSGSSARDTMSTPGLSGGRFDAATFGTALINVAREGVDRLGTPTLGSSSSGAESASAGGMAGGGGGTGSQSAEGHAATNLNENLKSFGKFFRREGGFGRFGRGGSGNE
jgi:hypothetical protein